MSVVVDHPLRLHDAYTGALLGSVPLMMKCDQIETPSAIAFSQDSSRIYCGLENRIKIVYLSTISQSKHTSQIMLTPTRRSKAGLKGAISCIKFSPSNPNMYVLGTFSGVIALYDARQDSDYEGRYPFLNSFAPLIKHDGLSAGVHTLHISQCGNLLYVLGRKSSSLLVWDIRNLRHETMSMSFKSNSVVSCFDVSNHTGQVIAADRRGYVCSWDKQNFDGRVLHLQKNPEKLLHTDPVACIKFHPFVPLVLTGSCSWQPVERVIGDSLTSRLGMLERASHPEYDMSDVLDDRSAFYVKTLQNRGGIRVWNI